MTDADAAARPQDLNLDGDGWTFETLEHGGAEPDTMPQAIRATDAAGRSWIYKAAALTPMEIPKTPFVFDEDS